MKRSLFDDGLDGLDLPSNNPQCSHEIGGKLQLNIKNIISFNEGILLEDDYAVMFI